MRCPAVPLDLESDNSTRFTRLLKYSGKSLKGFQTARQEVSLAVLEDVSDFVCTKDKEGFQVEARRFQKTL